MANSNNLLGQINHIVVLMLENRLRAKKRWSINSRIFAVRLNNNQCLYIIGVG